MMNGAAIATSHPSSTLLCVPPSDVAKLWPAVSKMIDNAYAAVDLPTPDVLSWLLTGKGLLWIVVDGEAVRLALTTSLEPHRSGLVCRMVAAGSDDLAFCLAHIGEIEQYARAEGCCKVTFEGRQGWARVLPGYVPRTVSFEKAI